MRPGSHTETPSVAAVARGATAICDPGGGDDGDLLRRAARAEFGENPPDEITLWLQDAGVTV